MHEWLTEAGFEWLTARGLDPIEGHGPYGESQEPSVFNTYNEESALSQVLQGAVYYREGCEYLIVQVHGGADVRGGYSRPIVLESNGHWELGVYDHGRCSVYCPKCEARWSYYGSQWDDCEGAEPLDSYQWTEDECEARACPVAGCTGTLDAHSY